MRLLWLWFMSVRVLDLVRLVLDSMMVRFVGMMVEAVAVGFGISAMKTVLAKHM